MNSPKYIEIENLVDFIVDNRGKTVPTVEEGIPLIATNCIKHDSIYPTYDKVRYISKDTYDTWFRSHLMPNDILFVNKGTPGRACIVPDPVRFVAAQDMVGLRFKEKYDPHYMLAIIRSKEIQKTIANNHVGLVIPHLRKQELLKLKLPILDSSTRNVIGDIYRSISDKIEINNKINIELEAMAKLIYDYWFVQFDFPDANGKPYKSSGGKMVYNEELKREIPEGWVDKTIAVWIENDKSGDWGKDSEQGNYTERVSCIRGADINGLNGNGEVKAPERFILEKNTHKLLENGDLIVEISGGSPTQSTGRMAFITRETQERFDNPLICSNFCKALTLKDETYLFNFVYQWQRLYDAGVLFGWEGKTSGIKNLLFENFVNNYKTVFPEKDIVEKFYQKIKPLHAKKQKNLRENQKLAELRDWLLPMLMNGQVTVKDAQEHINKAAEPQENYG